MHYSGYTEEELKPTAQLMLDYVVRSSSLADATTVITMNPLLTTMTTNEIEHPNFIKKYAAKKVSHPLPSPPSHQTLMRVVRV